ncbi:GlcNAc-PI de-N-acetylase [Poriferisphaera corsica]|uniref:GlcNAc-PI de-N-acetylase n=2 Tax=Poriferisphaera corsica TaxID=2528020 RepID=A0A517YPX0_9BACT|nr:GlcNAc-PI de-N-acetylase [Poriferisphaera corsica]
MSSDFQLVKLENNKRVVSENFADILADWQPGKECFLFVTPHDDDAILGGGLMLDMALANNIPVYILCVTDGSAGYCTLEEKENIIEVRAKETYDCYEAMGVPTDNIVWMGFPDGQLSQYLGRREAKSGDPSPIQGYTGLVNSFVFNLRKIQPTRVFLPTNADLHPDHRATHSELLISLFHAMGGIWPELGPSLPKLPSVYELGVYCDFPEPPQIQLKSTPERLESKVNGILKFVSQTQIAALIENVRKSGPYEYYRDLQFALYSPDTYHERFAEK